MITCVYLEIRDVIVAHGLIFQGNLQFESDGESVQIVGLDAVNHISELTDTDPESVSKTLLHRTVATGGGEVIDKGHTAEEACCGRDAFAKVLFTCFMLVHE